MHVNTDGVGIMAKGPIGTSKEAMDLLRDVIIIKLWARGVPQTSIAHLLNVNQSSVSRRLKVIPEHVQRYYATLTLV